MLLRQRTYNTALCKCKVSFPGMQIIFYLVGEYMRYNNPPYNTTTTQATRRSNFFADAFLSKEVLREKTELGENLYLVKDHLGNIRMVLTEQNESHCYPAATVEDARVATEKLFYDISDGRIVQKSSTAANNISSFENKIYRTHGGLTGEKTGLGITLKVMSGDNIKIKAESFYTLPSGGAGNPLTMSVTDLLNTLAGSSVISSSKGAVTTTDISSVGNNSSNLTNFITSNNNNSTTTAKAYLNWILFDDQLKYITAGADPVQTNGGYKMHDVFINSPVNVSKNGFLYVYVSNESNLSVYFDNLQITHTPGPILEETHYYPFGLRMEGISSRAANITPNKDKTFQGQKFDDDLGINYHSFKYRNHDPQIGRFIEIDPLSDKYVYNSTYAFSENCVTTHVELEGREKFPVNPENGTGSPQLKKELEQKGKQPVVPQPQPVPTTKEKKEAENTSPGRIGIGAQISVGIGGGDKGTQLSVGVFGTPGTVGQLFFTVSEPKPNSTEFNVDYSASSQLLIGYSPTGKFDLTGKGVSAGLGGGPASASYSTDNPANPSYHIVGVGPSVGVKASGSYAESKTVTIPVYIPILIGMLKQIF